jgi:hypothetical protein
MSGLLEPLISSSAVNTTPASSGPTMKRVHRAVDPSSLCHQVRHLQEVATHRRWKVTLGKARGGKAVAKASVLTPAGAAKPTPQGRWPGILRTLCPGKVSIQAEIVGLS